MDTYSGSHSRPRHTLYPNIDGDHPSALDLRGFLRGRNVLPPGVQEVLFYIASRFDGCFYPLAVASQVPPTAAAWKHINKAFVVTSTQKMNAYLADPRHRAGLTEDVQRAAAFYSRGRGVLQGPDEPPGTSPAEERAIWLAHPTFACAARVLTRCLLPQGRRETTEYWAPLALHTTFGLEDFCYRAVVLDVTDLDRVACGVVENKYVRVRDGFTGREEREIRRTVWSVPRWVATRNEFEKALDMVDD